MAPITLVRYFYSSLVHLNQKIWFQAGDIKSIVYGLLFSLLGAIAMIISVKTGSKENGFVFF